MKNEEIDFISAQNLWKTQSRKNSAENNETNVDGELETQNRKQKMGPLRFEFLKLTPFD